MGEASTSVKWNQDLSTMVEAIKALERLDSRVNRPSPFQLKIGEFNFWPNTSKITIGPGWKHPERWLDALSSAIGNVRG